MWPPQSTGQVFNLNLELELPDPPLFGRKATPPHRARHGTGHDDEIDCYNTQSSSQWDGFRHVRHPKYGFYNGVADADHGVHHWARRGIVGRGVLVDVARSAGRTGTSASSPTRPIRSSPTICSAALAAQGTVVEPGDILLIRTGWLAWYRALDRGTAASRLRRAPRAAVVRPAPRHRDRTRAVEPAHRRGGGRQSRLRGDAARVVRTHRGFLRAASGHSNTPKSGSSTVDARQAGAAVGELFDLDALADACAADGRYTFLFTSAPLNLQPGVASPPNALAIR